MAKAEEHRTFNDWIYPLENKIITKKKKKLVRQGQQSPADKE